MRQTRGTSGGESRSGRDHRAMRTTRPRWRHSRGGMSEEKGLAVFVLAIDKRPCFLQVWRAPDQTTKGATA